MASDRTLAVAGLLLLVGVGGGLLWLLFSPVTAMIGVAVMLGGFALLASLYGLLRLLEIWANKSDDEDE